MSTTASHQPAALWMLSSFYYSSSSHLQDLIYHEIKRMSILFSPELDNINSNRVHFLLEENEIYSKKNFKNRVWKNMNKSMNKIEM